MALGCFQPLTEMSNRSISLEIKAAGHIGWQPYQVHLPIVMKSGSLNLLESSGPVQVFTGIALSFTVSSCYVSNRYKIRRYYVSRLFIRSIYEIFTTQKAYLIVRAELLSRFFLKHFLYRRNILIHFSANRKKNVIVVQHKTHKRNTCNVYCPSSFCLSCPVCFPFIQEFSWQNIPVLHTDICWEK